MLKKIFGSKRAAKKADASIAGSSWGKNDDFRIASADVDVLRRMCMLLRKAETAAGIWIIVAAVLTALFVNYTLLLKSFETVIFSDGTELVCAMEGRNAEVSARDQFGRKLKTRLWLKNN